MSVIIKKLSGTYGDGNTIRLKALNIAGPAFWDLLFGAGTFSNYDYDTNEVDFEQDGSDVPVVRASSNPWTGANTDIGDVNGGCTLQPDGTWKCTSGTQTLDVKGSGIAHNRGDFIHHDGIGAADDGQVAWYDESDILFWGNGGGAGNYARGYFFSLPSNWAVQYGTTTPRAITGGTGEQPGPVGSIYARFKILVNQAINTIIPRMEYGNDSWGGAITNDANGITGYKEGTKTLADVVYTIYDMGGDGVGDILPGDDLDPSAGTEFEIVGGTLVYDEDVDDTEFPEETVRTGLKLSSGDLTILLTGNPHSDINIIPVWCTDEALKAFDMYVNGRKAAFMGAGYYTHKVRREDVWVKLDEYGELELKFTGSVVLNDLKIGFGAAPVEAYDEQQIGVADSIWRAIPSDDPPVLQILADLINEDEPSSVNKVDYYNFLSCRQRHTGATRKFVDTSVSGMTITGGAGVYEKEVHAHFDEDYSINSILFQLAANSLNDDETIPYGDTIDYMEVAQGDGFTFSLFSPIPREGNFARVTALCELERSDAITDGVDEFIDMNLGTTGTVEDPDLSEWIANGEDEFRDYGEFETEGGTHLALLGLTLEATIIRAAKFPIIGTGGDLTVSFTKASTSVNLGNSLACLGVVSGVTGTPVYSWKIDGVERATTLNYTIPNTYLDADTHTIDFSVTDDLGTVDADQQEVFVGSVSGSSSVISDGGTNTYTTDVPTPVWSIVSGSGSINSSTGVLTRPGSGSGTIVIKATKTGDSTVYATKSVTYAPVSAPTAGFSFEGLISGNIPAGQTVGINDASSGSGRTYQYQITNSDYTNQNCGTTAEPDINSYIRNGSNSVKQIVTNGGGSANTTHSFTAVGGEVVYAEWEEIEGGRIRFASPVDGEIAFELIGKIKARSEGGDSEFSNEATAPGE